MGIRDKLKTAFFFPFMRENSIYDAVVSEFSYGEYDVNFAYCQ